MANTKVTQHVIANNAITADQLASAAVTDAKLHSTLDLSSKTLTLPATAIPSASTATTQSASDNSTKLATTAYVTTAIANLNDSAPTALNTLNELAAALNDDANFSATITTALGTKLPLAGGTLTGDLVLSGAPTSGLHPATKTYTDTADALKLNLSGGTLTGDLILNTTTALKIPAGTTGQRPTAATGQIRWNTTDGALEVYNGTAWTAVGTGSSNKVLDTFTGDNSTTDFTLSVTPANEDALMVFIDGAYQEAGDYVLTNNVLALDTAPLTGEKISAHIVTAAVHDGTSAVNNQFTATAGQTAFTLTQDPKSENNTQVYINGVYQQKTDYTVTGTTLTFDTGLTVGDVVEVNMFTVATLGNTDTVTEGVSNLYHTTARARGAISVSGNALSYNSSTGVITSAYEENPTFTGTVTTPTLITGAYGASGSAGDGFRLNSTDLYGQIDASDKIRLNVNGDSFLNGGNVGINETSPDYKLHISGSGSAAQMQIESTANNNAQLIFRNTTSSGSGIIGGFHIGLLGDTSGDGLIYHHHDKPIRFYTNAANTMTLTGEDGMLHLNGRSGAHGYTVPQDQSLGYTNNLNAGAFGILHRDSYDSYVTGNSYYYKTGGSSSWRAKYGAYKSVVLGMVNGVFSFDCSTTAPGSNGAATVGLANIVQINSDGISMAAGKGISFSANSNAGGMSSELLDDYEEGTWTVSEVNGQGGTVTTNRANYTKIGRMVFASASVTVGTTTNTNVLNLSLPFSSSIVGYYLGGGNVSYHTLPTTQSVNLRPNIENGASNVFFLYGTNSNASLNVKCSEASTKRIDFFVQYQVS